MTPQQAQSVQKVQEVQKVQFAPAAPAKCRSAKTPLGVLHLHCGQRDLGDRGSPKTPVECSLFTACHRLDASGEVGAFQWIYDPAAGAHPWRHPQILEQLGKLDQETCLALGRVVCEAEPADLRKVVTVLRQVRLGLLDRNQGAAAIRAMPRRLPDPPQCPLFDALDRVKTAPDPAAFEWLSGASGHHRQRTQLLEHLGRLREELFLPVATALCEARPPSPAAVTILRRLRLGHINLETALNAIGALKENPHAKSA